MILLSSNCHRALGCEVLKVKTKNLQNQISSKIYKVNTILFLAFNEKHIVFFYFVKVNEHIIGSESLDKQIFRQ